MIDNDAKALSKTTLHMKIRLSVLLEWLIPIMIVLACLNGIVKALTGVRYGPLIVDGYFLTLLILIILTKLKGNHFKVGVLDLIAGSLIGLALLEMLHPNIPSFQAGLEGFRKFAFMISGFYVGRYLIKSRSTLKLFLWVLIPASTLIALYGIKQFTFPSELDYRLIELSSASPITYLMGGHIRAFSTMSSPFHLGIFLTGTLLLLFTLWQKDKSKRILYLILAGIQFVALIMTVTKSNWFGLITGILVLVLLENRRPLRLFLQLILVVIISWLIIYFAFQLTQNNPALRTINSGLEDLVNPLQANTFVFRLNLWKDEVIPLMIASPWIGYGTSSAGEGLGFYYEGTNKVYIVSHNLFFKIFFELGIIGVVIFLTLILSIFFRIYLTKKWISHSLLFVYRNWTLSFVIATLVAGLTGAILDAYPVNILFWLLLGIATRLPSFEFPQLSESIQSAPISNSVVLES